MFPRHTKHRRSTAPVYARVSYSGAADPPRHRLREQALECAMRIFLSREEPHHRLGVRDDALGNFVGRPPRHGFGALG